MQASSDPWKVIEYEVKMFKATYKIFFTRSQFTKLSYARKNAIEESAVLHTRNLCELFLERGTETDDIKLRDLLKDWPTDTRYCKLKSMKDKLKVTYGSRRDKNMPCWNFNKRMMHPTSHRGREYNYEKDLWNLYPLIEQIIAELKCLTEKTFRLSFDGPTCVRKLFCA